MKPNQGPVKKGQPARPSRAKPDEKPNDAAEYWQSRAERFRNQFRRCDPPAIRDHFVKMAAGYDELAQRARELRIEPSAQTTSSRREGARASDEHDFRSDPTFAVDDAVRCAHRQLQDRARIMRGEVKHRAQDGGT